MEKKRKFKRSGKSTITLERDHGLIIAIGIAKDKNQIILMLPFTVLTFTLHSKRSNVL